jgi:acetate kinase
MAVLTVNSGSSSLKASLFLADGARLNFHYGHLGSGQFADHAAAFAALLRDLGEHRPSVVGHRFVHGGDVNEAARLLDAGERRRLEGIVPLAPLHLPGNLMGAELCAAHFPVPQVACFDTAFHATLPELAWRLPIPARFGLRRYGFHGLNYAHVARQLPALLGEAAQGRIVVAHLGSGSSLCLLENLRSVDTSMGYTPAGGIVMGTRSGDLDPGVMLELAQRMDAAALARLTYREMGLLALSDGESNDMATLLQSSSPQARFAVEYYARQVCAAIGAYAAKSGGLEALVFTGGIGENSPLIRQRICANLGFMGFAIDEMANERGTGCLSGPLSRPVWLVPADEEAMIARLCADLGLH